MIEEGCILHLQLCLSESLFDLLGSVGGSADESASELIERRRCDEECECLIAEEAFEVGSTLDIDIEDHMVPFVGDALYLRAQGAVIAVFIHLFVLNESTLFDAFLELIDGDEVILFAILFLSTRSACGGRDRELKVGTMSEELLTECGLARPEVGWAELGVESLEFRVQS